MTARDDLAPSVTGLYDPHQEERNYALSGERPLVNLLDNPWYPPYVRDASHYHNCMEIGLCLSGCGWIRIADRRWRFDDGTIAVVPCGVRHSQQNEGERVTHWIYLLVDEALLLRETPPRGRAAIEKTLAQARRGLCLSADPEYDPIRATISALYRIFRKEGAARDLEIDALLNLLMARLASASEPMPDFVSDSERPRQAVEPALRYVSEHFTQEVRIAEMALRCAMSESYFRRVFSEIMGMPPLEYVNRYRVNHALRQLRDTNETVASIAAKMGFPSIATFNRNFRRFVGQSPAEWRKNERI